MDSFPERLDEALEGRKAAAIAMGAGISDSRMSSYRHGRRCPRLEVFRALVIELGVSADWLLGLSDDRTPSQDLDEVREQAGDEATDDVIEEFSERFSYAAEALPTNYRRAVVERLSSGRPKERERNRKETG